MKTKQTMHYFHVGRGGQFHNGGTKSYVGIIQVEDIFDLALHSDLNYHERIGGKFYRSFFDNAGNEIATQKELSDMLKKGRVVVDLDGIYDTDIYVLEDKMLDDEKILFENE